MKTKATKNKQSLAKSSKTAKKQNSKKSFPGYPLYPASEDIYNRGNKVENLDFEDGESDNGLDIPGAELDDAQERIGSEDEENNYYSLGGENHQNLEEEHED
ncbi:MAG TPA: hypothetical protein VNB90_00965 [Cytophagaceae bacterium]|nr:hypothetical protein [Cytophagaceae bacterium]